MFIVFEGIDGSGKTTLIEFFQKELQNHLAAAGMLQKVNRTREPGGSELAEQIRALIMNYHSDMHIQTEILLMYAARIDHLQQMIIPHLQAGDIVLSDRYFYSSFAYQGGGRSGSLELLNDLQKHAGQQFGKHYQPDYLIFLDVDVELAAERRQARRAAQTGVVDRFEAFDIDFQRRVHQAYQTQIKAMPHFMDKAQRFKNNLPGSSFNSSETQLIQINAHQSIEAIQKELLAVIEQIIALI